MYTATYFVDISYANSNPGEEGLGKAEHAAVHQSLFMREIEDSLQIVHISNLLFLLALHEMLSHEYSCYLHRRPFFQVCLLVQMPFLRSREMYC